MVTHPEHADPIGPTPDAIPVPDSPPHRESTSSDSIRSWGAEPGASVIAVLLAMALIILLAQTWANPALRGIIVPVLTAAADDHGIMAESVQTLSAAGGLERAAVVPDMRIDLNSADEYALQTIPSIGPVLASRIIDERTNGGPFADLQNLADRVKGIGPKTVDRIRQYVCLSAAPPLKSADSAGPESDDDGP